MLSLPRARQSARRSRSRRRPELISLPGPIQPYRGGPLIGIPCARPQTGSQDDDAVSPYVNVRNAAWSERATRIRCQRHPRAWLLSTNQLDVLAGFVTGECFRVG